MRTIFLRSLSAIVILLAVMPASAGVVDYYTLGSWTTATTGTINTIDFGTTGQSGASLSFGTAPYEVTFTPLVAGSLDVVSYYSACDVYCMFATGSNNPGLVATPSSAAVTAMAVYLFTQSSGQQLLHITVHTASGNQGFDVTGVSGNGGPPTFFGVVSDAAITSIEISTVTGGNGILAIDNLKLNGGDVPPPPSVDSPEVPSLGYIGVGVLAILLGRKRHAVRLLTRS